MKVSAEIYEALLYCAYVAEDADTSLGDSNYKKYTLAQEWITTELEVED